MQRCPTSIDTLSVQLPICSSSSRAPIDSIGRTCLQSYQTIIRVDIQIIHKSFTNHSQIIHKSFTNHSQIIHKSFKHIEVGLPESSDRGHWNHWAYNEIHSLHCNIMQYLISSNRSQLLNPAKSTTSHSSFYPVPWPAISYNWGENQHILFQTRNFRIALLCIVGHRRTSSWCKVSLAESVKYEQHNLTSSTLNDIR